MTQAQALRQQRRDEREAQRRDEVRQTILGVVFIALLIALYFLVGTQDYMDDRREIERWESQGITITRW